jgi:1-pyrroline-5-carboxylate dehydrogenase
VTCGSARAPGVTAAWSTFDPTGYDACSTFASRERGRPRMTERFRITYATLSADNEELQASYDAAAERMKAELGKEYPVIVNGEERWRDEKYDEPSPIDHDVIIGRFSQATAQDVDDAVKAAKEFSLEWDRMGWRKRVDILRNVADVMEERLFDLASLMAYEVGKSRLEALGDVQETAELIRWNCDEMEKHEGFRTPMSGLGAAGDYYDVMRPYGVWAVISPFNFPMALSGGPSSGALVAGNCVVLKPSNQGALLGYKLYECYRDGGVPPGAFHLVIGRGAVAGEALWKHPDVDGITFTGSYQVGMDIYKHFASDVPKPVICEMGGKNPTIVTKNADLDKATDGVMRSAFGFGGQKCSACSRVFVERDVYDDFIGQLKQKAEKIKVGDPLQRDVYLGPIINEAALDTFEEAAEEARKNGTIVTGGQRITEGDLGRGLFVEPTIVEAPEDSWIWKKELFVPLVAVAPFDELDDAIERANDTEYGLTAGLFSEDADEVNEWLDRIQAGVVYVNRRAGSTTGAWPGVQPFGGWKGSGTTGKAGGGPYYVMQYLREQSRTVIAE